MKRIIVPLTFAVVLGMGALASAALTHYAGTVDQGGTVTFGVSKHNGNKTVKHFHFVAPATCDDGHHNFDNAGAEPGPMPVVDAKFHGKVSLLPSGHEKVSGKLTHKGRKAFGKIDLTGNVTNHHNCSGHDTWNAARK